MHVNQRQEARRKTRAMTHEAMFQAAIRRESGRRFGRHLDDAVYTYEAVTNPVPGSAFTRRNATFGAVIGTEKEVRDGIVLYERSVLVPMHVRPRATSRYWPNQEQARGKR